MVILFNGTAKWPENVFTAVGILGGFSDFTCSKTVQTVLTFL